MAVILTLLVNITFLFHTCYRVCFIIISDLLVRSWIVTGATCGAGDADPFRNTWSHPDGGSHSLLAMSSQCQFCLTLDYSIWMLILVCLLGWVWLCGLDLLLLESVQTLLKITHLATRKPYLVIICPNSHEKLTKIKIRSSWTQSKITHLAYRKWYLVNICPKVKLG